jgi:hypothetical protein
MVLRIKASDVAAIIGQNPYKTRDDVLAEYTGIGTHTEREFTHELLHQPEEVQHEVRSILEKSMVCDIPVPTFESPVIQEYVKHEVYKNNGTHREGRTQKDHGVTPDRKRYTMKITDDVILVGYIDGRKDNCIVEIKNRQRRLFHKVPLYEDIQCQVYMKLTGVHECTFIEQYGSDSNTFHLTFSESRWDEIFQELVQFSHQMCNIPSSE